LTTFEDLARLSALPIVDLRNVSPPSSGILVEVPAVCGRNFGKSDACRRHYEQLARMTAPADAPVQCPFGFASYPVHLNASDLAFTAVIPHPRLGGAAERHMAKTHPHNKVPIESFKRAAAVLANAERQIGELEDRSIEAQAVALHEIRKLNRNVKQTAERLCLDESPGDPELADSRLVTIWKSAELMSVQFDVVELLANESLVGLPLNATSEPYRVFDKCVRIYRNSSTSDRIRLAAPYGYRPRIRACDRTFNMIPTVLIENALKYSPENSVVFIEFSSQGSWCIVQVRNQYGGRVQLTNQIFKKGVRLATGKEGSGNGLYLAKLVAKQHLAELSVTSKIVGNDLMECVFTLCIPELRRAGCD